MPFTFGIAEDDFEGRGDLLLGRAAADIEEVRGLAAGVLDDVHRGHREARAVDEAGDVSVEADVVEVELGRGDFARVFLALVAHRDDLGLPVERVVVEVEFGIERRARPSVVTTSGFTSICEQSRAMKSLNIAVKSFALRRSVPERPSAFAILRVW